MIEILAEMVRQSPYTKDGHAGSGMGLLLAQLSNVASRPGLRARSLPAMRQAWWRWTTDGPQAATPPVEELALIVRYANNHGWLKQLRRPDCNSLVRRLLDELNVELKSAKRSREVKWENAALNATWTLVDFLEKRVVEIAQGDAEEEAMPVSWKVQAEVKTMMRVFTETVVSSLDHPREYFSEPHETDSYLRPHEGWPDVFRQMASEISEILIGAANEYEELEVSQTPAAPKRKKLIRPMPKDAGQ
ncbi:hypothetical protein [Hydrogenophaga borbori]|uniref:hypothetical protein n=1 Tax=Hydrogenophaga borbori TaxID=2294117 RepID=UPI00301D27A6